MCSLVSYEENEVLWIRILVISPACQGAESVPCLTFQVSLTIFIKHSASYSHLKVFSDSP